MAPYLLGIPLLVVLETIRYLSGWVELLQTSDKALFAARFVITDANWFFAFVSLPVSLMLLGGHFLSRRQHFGHYMAWWMAFFIIAQGLVQISVAFAGGRPITLYTGLAGVVALAFMLAGVVICQRLLSIKAVELASAPAVTLTTRQLNLWTLLFVALVAMYAVNLYRQTGPIPVTIIVGSMLDAPEHLERLRNRSLGKKRSLAIREFVLGAEALHRFVTREPLRRVHEAVFGILALESEPIDPRL